jgi:glycine cleavage system aminomethyltransferase T
MLDMRGKVKRRLVLLRLDAAAPPPVGSEVTDPSGTVVGESLSSAGSPLWGGAVALARIAASAAETGTRLRVGETAAEVVAPNR